MQTDPDLSFVGRCSMLLNLQVSAADEEWVTGRSRPGMWGSNVAYQSLGMEVHSGPRGTKTGTLAGDSDVSDSQAAWKRTRELSGQFVSADEVQAGGTLAKTGFRCSFF
jgi:hypothetical protein